MYGTFVDYLRRTLEDLPPRACLAGLPAARLPALLRVLLVLRLDMRTGKYTTTLLPGLKLEPDFTLFQVATSAVVTR